MRREVGRKRYKTTEMNRRDKGREGKKDKNKKQRQNIPCVGRKIVVLAAVHRSHFRQTISLVPVTKKGLGL